MLNRTSLYMLLICTIATPAQADDISGTYAVAGEDEIRKPYSGTATITMTVKPNAGLR